MQSPETGMVDFAPRKFSIRETQGDREVCKYEKQTKMLISHFIFVILLFLLVSQEEKDVFEKKKDPSLGQFVNPLDDPNKSLSQAKAKVLQNVDTFFYIGTEVCLYQVENLFHHQKKIETIQHCPFISNELNPGDDKVKDQFLKNL